MSAITETKLNLSFPSGLHLELYYEITIVRRLLHGQWHCKISDYVKYGTQLLFSDKQELICHETYSTNERPEIYRINNRVRDELLDL